jgi:23S rRNA (adenine2030-N6)-methyltransferase
MNYRHAFHAGNFADVAKHLALVSVLLHLHKKDVPFAVIDSHAGRGVYDLTAGAAQLTGEAAAGIARLRGLTGGPQALTAYLSLAGQPQAYPGSPLLAARLLRPQDRLVAIEKHLEEGGVLAETLRQFRKARVEIGDGYARLPALLPPPERRGVVLIDPPYESEDEFAEVARVFAASFRRFATGIYMIWFPVKSAAAANGFCGEVLAAGVAKALRFDITRKAGEEGRLSAAGLLVVNPPWQFEAQMRKTLAPVLPLLEAEARFTTLAER